MKFSFPDILLVIAIFQLLFLSLFLFFEQRGKRLSNLLLGSFFFFLCLNLIDSFLINKNAYNATPSLALWSSSFSLLYGPLLYLYTRSILHTDWKSGWTKWRHLLPFIVVFVLMEAAYLSCGHEVQLRILNSISRGKTFPYIGVISAVIALQFFSYLVAIMRILHRYKLKAHEQFSSKKLASVNWLSSTLVFFTLFLLLFALHGVIRLTAFPSFYPVVLNTTILVLFVFMNRVLFQAMKKPELFSLLTEAPDNKLDTTPPKYASSTLSESDKKNMLVLLQQHMSAKKPYLAAELSIDQLASQLAIKPRALSQVINESLQLSFFEFVNQYRIKEAQQMLTNPQDPKITVLEVLYKVGFNSKSSFNTLFKKYTGLTPVEFRRKNTS
jgi:AraC-like DNA-binding protein